MNNNELLQAMSLMMDEKFGKRFDAIEKRLDNMDKRFDSIDKRFESMDKRFESMDKRFESMDKRFESMDKRFDSIDKRFDSIDKRFESIDMRLNKIQEEIVLIHRNIADINDVINKDIKVQLNIIRENYVPASQRYMMEVERISTMEEDIKGLKSIVAEKTAEWMKPKKK